MCVLGDFLALFAPVLRQIARYLPHHKTEMPQKLIPNRHTINLKQFLRKAYQNIKKGQRHSAFSPVENTTIRAVPLLATAYSLDRHSMYTRNEDEENNESGNFSIVECNIPYRRNILRDTHGKATYRDDA